MSNLIYEELQEEHKRMREALEEIAAREPYIKDNAKYALEICVSIAEQTLAAVGKSSRSQ